MELYFFIPKMEILLGVVLAMPFFYFNYKIVKTDIQKKRIPNRYLKYLLFLLPFWYLYAWYFGYFSDVNIWIFFLQIFLSFLVGFLIYHFGKWGAGDAKYLLVLALFIPHIGIIPFIFSIAFLILTYTIIVLLYYVMIDAYNFINFIIKKSGELKINTHKFRTKISDINYIVKLAKFTILLVLTFLGVKLIKLFILDKLIENFNLSQILATKYLYLWVLVIGILFLIFILIGKYLYERYKNMEFLIKLQKKYFNKNHTISKHKKYLYDLVILEIMLIFTLISLLYTYLLIPQDMSNLFIKLFTTYLIIYIFIKAIKEYIKFSFLRNQEYTLSISEIQEGLIINKKNLYNLVKGHKKEKELEIKIQNINTSIKHNDIESIKALYNDVSTKDKQQSIGILKVFALGVYIFLGFILTLLLRDIGIKTSFSFLIEEIFK